MKSWEKNKYYNIILFNLHIGRRCQKKFENWEGGKKKGDRCERSAVDEGDYKLNEMAWDWATLGLGLDWGGNMYEIRKGEWVEAELMVGGGLILKEFWRRHGGGRLVMWCVAVVLVSDRYQGNLRYSASGQSWILWDSQECGGDGSVDTVHTYMDAHCDVTSNYTLWGGTLIIYCTVLVQCIYCIVRYDIWRMYIYTIYDYVQYYIPYLDTYIHT